MTFTPTGQYERIPIYNDSGESVPAFACMGVKALRVVNGVTFLDVEKPSTTLRIEYIFNGPSAVAVGKYGIGYRGPLLLCKTSPTLGQGFGPKPGQWEAELGFPSLFAANGVHISSGSTYIGYGEYRPIVSLIGKASGAISARSSTTPGSGNFEIWYNNAGTLTDAGFSDITINNLSQTAGTSGNFMGVTFIEGEWWLSWEDCA